MSDTSELLVCCSFFNVTTATWRSIKQLDISDFARRKCHYVQSSTFVCVCVCVCTVKSVEGSRTRGKLLSEVISTAGPEAQ